MISPCNKICVIDPITKICEGCGRTISEIASWASLTEAQRRSIMDRLKDFNDGKR